MLLRDPLQGLRRHVAVAGASDAGRDLILTKPSYNLPYALELCERSFVLSDGVVVADGPTFDVLTDEACMKAHRIELPFGFDLEQPVRATKAAGKPAACDDPSQTSCGWR